MRPAGLLRDQAVLVVIGEQVGRPVDEPLDLRAIHPGHLLGRVGNEVEAPAAALLSVTLHGFRIVRRDHDQIEVPSPLSLQAAGLISYRRGKILVTDRTGLETASCECYAIVQQRFDAFLTPPSSAVGGNTRGRRRKD